MDDINGVGLLLFMPAIKRRRKWEGLLWDVSLNASRKIWQLCLCATQHELCLIVHHRTKLWTKEHQMGLQSLSRIWNLCFPMGLKFSKFYKTSYGINYHKSCSQQVYLIILYVVTEYNNVFIFSTHVSSCCWEILVRSRMCRLFSNCKVMLPWRKPWRRYFTCNKQMFVLCYSTWATVLLR